MSGGESVGYNPGEWSSRTGGWRPMPVITAPFQPDLSRTALADLRHPGLDAIRFASYRTAAKLRYVQKRTNSKLPVQLALL